MGSGLPGEWSLKIEGKVIEDTGVRSSLPSYESLYNSRFACNAIAPLTFCMLALPGITWFCSNVVILFIPPQVNKYVHSKYNKQFSTFLHRAFIELDAGEEGQRIVEWQRSASTIESDGFEIRRATPGPLSVGYSFFEDFCLDRLPRLPPASPTGSGPHSPS